MVHDDKIGIAIVAVIDNSYDVKVIKAL